MPILSQMMIRAALIWLGLGTTLGALMLATKAGVAPGWLLNLRSSHAHILLLGWTIQLAAGTAIWILPRLDASGTRGDLRPAWFGAAALNLGVACAIAGALVNASPGAPSWLLTLAGILELAGGLLLGRHLWQRALPFRTLPRPTGTQQ